MINAYRAFLLPKGWIPTTIVAAVFLLYTAPMTLNAQTQKSPRTNYTGIAYANTKTLFAVGDSGTIARSLDGGKQWSVEAATCGITSAFNDICFIDVSHGFVVGEKGTLIATTNGGSSWFKVSIGQTHDLQSIFFFDDQRGTIVGRGGIILHSTDGGITWKTQTSGTANDLNAVSFTDQNNGTIVGAQGTILKTSNGGETWEDISSSFISCMLSSVVFSGFKRAHCR